MKKTERIALKSSLRGMNVQKGCIGCKDRFFRPPLSSFGNIKYFIQVQYYNA
ncbi:MAG: hypothetical protein IPQ06_11845 [Chitinophagaceae bacterium]|nr:hypothetical protein [Chitinophagaceae bacterium]MBK9569334.1 hypothetical protein [Chitinophagaceae bacterium]MBL0273735.1 hypothetical protein [Chitinophagaceae bacterium]